MEEVSVQADLIEVRLDALEDTANLDLPGLVRQSPLPLIFTNRSRDEGGSFHGSEMERLDLLSEAIRAGASHIDIELRTAPELRTPLIREARGSGTKVIVSFHDFAGTPDKKKLDEILGQALAAGADIPKIVTMANSPEDVQTVLSLYSGWQGQSIIAFCMGSQGRISRLACLALGAYLTFASPSFASGTAPGQIPLRDMRAIVDFLFGPEGQDLCGNYGQRS